MVQTPRKKSTKKEVLPVIATETKSLSSLEKQALSITQRSFDGVFSMADSDDGIIFSGVEVALSASSEDDSVLTGTIPDMGLSAIAKNALYDIALPKEVPAVAFKESVISITPETKNFSITATSVIDWDFNLGKKKLKTQVSLTLSRTAIDSGTDSIQCEISLQAQGELKLVDQLTIQQFDLKFELEDSQDWSLSGDITSRLANQVCKLSAGYTQTSDTEILTFSADSATEPKTEVSLSAIAKGLLNGATLPAEIPDAKFSDFSLSLSSRDEFSLNGTSIFAWDFNTGGQKLTTQIDLSLNQTVSELGESIVDCSIALEGKGVLKIADELLLKQFGFKFDLQPSQDWSLSGDVTTALLDHEFKLAAGYIQTGDTQTLTLSQTRSAPVDLVTVAGVGSLNVSELSMSMTEQTIQGQTAGYAWDVSAKGRIKVNNVFQLGGQLSLYQTVDQTAGLNFIPASKSLDRQVADASLPLAISSNNGEQAVIELNLGPISIVRAPIPENSGGEWSFESEVALAFKHLPQAIQSLLPKETKAQFKADAQAVSLTADRLLAPVPLAIPDLDINGAKIPLGTAALDASNLSIRIDDTNVELSAEVGLGLPADLNKVFGVKADGSPAMDFFKVYDAANPDDSIVKLQLAVGSAGITLTPTSSPIEAIQWVELGGEVWCNCDFGDFGEIRFQVPEFSLEMTTSSFKAKGGFETVRPLKLPLTPFKTLLTGTELKEVADTLPDSLALQAISILDAQKNFRINELIGLFENVTGTTLTPEIRQVLTTITDRANQLPERFKHYLNIEIPDSFRFDIAITPDGGVRIDVGVKEGDPPVKLLAVGINSGLPVFTGIELRSFSFGEMLGGSLFLMEVDARFDQFDLATLAASLLLPQDADLPLPASRDLHRRLIIDKLFMIIVYQTGVPIPIPLFFDQLGVEYLGLPGAALQSHVSFPMPKLNLMDLGKLLSPIKPFFTDPNYFLDPDNRPEDMDVTFSLGKNYIQLPKYLGHEVVGSKAELLNVSAYQYTAKLLNGLKRLSLNDLVQALPLKYRVGQSKITFGSLKTQATWLFTTPDEFRQIAPQHLPISSGEVSNALTVLYPSGGTHNEQGLVTFLQGSWNVPQVAEFEAMFGLVASGSMGFQTGFKIAGNIANLMDMELSGRVSLNAPQPQHSNGIPARSYCLEFSGRDYVQVPSSPVLNKMDAVTVEMWFRWKKEGSVVNFLMGKGIESLEIHLGGMANGIRFIPTSQVYIDTLPNSFTPGEWVHLACVYDPGQSIGRIYLNGIETQTLNNGSQGLNTPLKKSSSDLYLGTRSNQTLHFEGQMDEVRIWNRARSAVEIQADMRSQPNGHESGLVGYWSFDEGTGTIARDQTHHGNHADLQSARWIQNSRQFSASSGAVFASNLPVSSGTVFQLAGHSHLTLLDRKIFLGDVQIVDDRFQLKGKFDLFPEGFPLTARGNLEGYLSDQMLSLTGDIETKLADITLANAKGIITNDRILLKGTWLGASTELQAEKQDGALALRGKTTVDLFGLRAASMLTLDSTGKARAQGTIDPINFSGVFKLAGAGNQARPSFDLTLQAGQISAMNIAGTVELLGLRREAQIKVSETGLLLKTHGKIFNSFESALTVTGGSLKDPHGFTIAATLQNDLFQALEDEVTSIIGKTADDATKSLTDAQGVVNTAQQEVNKLNVQIAERRRVIQATRAEAQRKVEELRQEVGRLQGPVNSLISQIHVKEQEWLRLDNDKYHAWPYVGVWLHKDPITLGKVGTELAGLRTAYGAANGALQGAKALLWEAERALEAIPTDTDPLIVTLSATREAATLPLQTAQQALEQIKKDLGALATLSSEIIQMGSNLLDIHEAQFKGILNQVMGGVVSLDLNLRFMNDERNISLTFNFHDLSSNSQKLAALLLPS